jgi:hypothetical protein
MGALVLSDELVRSAVPSATALIERELRQATAVITDAQFFSTLLSGVTPVPASGTTTTAARLDISNLLESVGLGQTSRPYFITTSALAKNLACMGSTADTQAFPQMTPMGGVLFGVPTLVSDGILAGDIVCIDASGIGGAPGEVLLREYREGVYQAESALDSPISGSTTLVSLFQQNEVAIVCERFFAGVKLRADAVGAITGAAYTPSCSPSARKQWNN